MQPVMRPAELEQAQQSVLAVHASDSLLDYLQALIAATRSGRWFVDGLSPRAGISLLRVAKARALMASATTSRPTTCRPCCRRPSRTGWCRCPAPGAAPSSRCGRWSRRCPSRDRGPAPDPAPRPAAVVARPAAARRHLDADQRNIYILPTTAGLVFAVTLVLMLLASINYQLNLGMR
jgi:hypothetical protein